MPADEQARRTSRLILLSLCIGQTIVGLDQRAIIVAIVANKSSAAAG